jgi:CheY-like chemotaxis protein
MDLQTFFAIIAGIATPVAAGIWQIWLVLKKPILDILASFQVLLASLKDQHEVCKTLVASNAMQIDVISSQQASISKGKWLTLIVDDSPLSRRLLLQVCAEISVDIPLVVRSMTTLAEAFEYLSYSNLIILDVSMADCDTSRAKYFLDCAGLTPVIIYSGSDYTLEDFPKAKAVICKSAGTAEIERQIREVILKQFSAHIDMITA